MPVAKIQNLSVHYGSFQALDNVTVEIPEGCIGLLGPNGAGKSTLIKTLLGLVNPSSGGGTVLGCDIKTEPKEVRRRVGYMPEQECHIPGMTGVGFVAYAGELSGMPPAQALRRAHEVLEYCGLGEARYRNIETYSTGMKQRAKLAQALVHSPKLLLLDEPTNGLDPKGRDAMLDLINDITHSKGMSVIVSSHLLPDVERTSDHILVMYQSKLRSSGSLSDLTRLEGRPVDVELREAQPAFRATAQKRGMEVTSEDDRHLRIRAEIEPEALNRQILEVAQTTGSQVRKITFAHRSLEEAFLEVLK
jgi:ABC-2 type transport system ATP-binding protein